MAQEAILRDRLENPIDFTCANGTGIEKGTLCVMLDPRTASGVSTADTKIAGITAREKI